MKYQRPQLKLLKDRLAEKRKFIQVIMGPRQVGKTTLVNQLLKSAKVPNHFVSADGVSISGHVWIQQQWQTARLKFKQSEAKEFLLVIDEIQKIDNWSEEIKQLWDEDTRTKQNIKLILLGSSRLLLQKGLTESLAGRFETIYLSHWKFSEMQKAFGWNENQFAWFGGYPGSVDLIKDENRWKQYVLHSLIETSISKDILMLTRVDKPALMKRLFELGCSYSGQILSYNKMLGQLLDAGNTTTLTHYLQLLDTAGMLAGIEKYSADKIRQRSSSPKFQVHNTALISAQSEDVFKNILRNSSAWGRIVESAVGAHLLNHSLTENFQLYYWRDGNNEVDFVIQKGKSIVGLEVKSGTSHKASGISAFKKKFPAAKLLLLGDSGLPWQEFIKLNPIELF
jgi:predicted AAA+ superfamily ATPase